MDSTVDTSHWPISITDTSGPGPVVLFIHGISTCKDYANPWRDQVFLPDNAGHAPFWNEPLAFNRLLRDLILQNPV